MKAAARKAADTRRVYAFEHNLILEAGIVNSDTPIANLRELAQRIWKDYGMDFACPEIVAGRGLRHGEDWFSFCLGRSRIVLSRSQRNCVTLIHELVHAMGFSTHGAGFQNRYAELLLRYL